MTIQATPAAADHSSRARVGVGTVALNFGAFLAAFALICAVVRIPVPLEKVPGVGPKFAFFTKHKDDYNLLFLGSSRVFHHYLPKQFDEQVRERTGVQVNSFNFGYDGMWPPESLYTLRQVLALKPANLRWVLIDLVHINPRIDPENMGTLRTEYWHDWRHTVMAWTAIPGERLPLLEKIGIALTHAENLAKRWTNSGRSAEWLRNQLLAPEKKKKAPKPQKWETTSGYEAGLDRVMAGAELKKYRKQVKDFRSVLAKAKLRPETQKAILEIAEEVRATGAEPIFVLAPTLAPKEKVSGLPGGVEFISFADPEKYPGLYEAANHYDAWHLNEAGARIFTRHLAERFSEKLEVNAPPGNPIQALR